MMKPFFRNEDGQGVAEYALIIAFVAIVVIVALRTLGGTVNSVFEDLTAKLNDAG
ncbi:MAG: Flp family type IVb pilin [Clostridiales bacterium]|nr:Flp family type IVb pilin [Clostridiales bacterium]